MIAKTYGMEAGPRIYGRVFTAWGTAGLLAPWFAGSLFDGNNSYTTQIAAAALLGTLSAGVAGLLWQRTKPASVNE